MIFDYALGGAVTLGLLVYLVYALVAAGAFLMTGMAGRRSPSSSRSSC